MWLRELASRLLREVYGVDDRKGTSRGTRHGSGSFCCWEKERLLLGNARVSSWRCLPVHGRQPLLPFAPLRSSSALHLPWKPADLHSTRAFPSSSPTIPSPWRHPLQSRAAHALRVLDKMPVKGLVL